MKNSHKVLIAFLAIIILVLASALIYLSLHSSDKAAEQLPTQSPAASPSSTPATTAASPTFTWQFKDAGTDQAAQAPLTTVSVKKQDGTVRTVGTYQGSCAAIDGTSWQLLQGESSGVICWFAGGGTEIGVFNEAGKVTFKESPLEEASEDTPGVRGDFKTLFTL